MMKKFTGLTVASNGVMLYVDGEAPMLASSEIYNVENITKKIADDIRLHGFSAIEIDEYKVFSGLEKVGVKIEMSEGIGGGVKVNGVNIGSAAGIEKQIKEITSGQRSAKGFKNFVRHFDKSAVQHSMDELLHFMERSDLTIADDGSIIGYKILCRQGNNFVDPHTKSVVQNVGSLVFMPRSKVNDDRRTACSTGLHVCSADYTRGFCFDVLTLVKVRPHDAIAVPHGESKMRCCSYQICALLPDDVYKHIVNGGKITDLPEGERIFADVIAGNHPPISNRVEVGVLGAFKAEPVKVKENPVKKAKASKPVPQVVKSSKRGVDIAALKKKIGEIKAIRSNKRTASEVRLLDYEKKYQAAKKLIVSGHSINEAADAIGIDRATFRKNIASGR